jgi:anti-anti-sigma factor
MAGRYPTGWRGQTRRDIVLSSFNREGSPPAVGPALSGFPVERCDMNPRSAFSAPVTVSVVIDGDGALVTTEGELDRGTVAAFDERVEEIVEAGRSPLTIDLSRVSFADVAGYRSMVRFSERCAREGVESIWLPPSRAVELLWRILGHPGRTTTGRAGGDGQRRTPLNAA